MQPPDRHDHLDKTHNVLRLKIISSSQISSRVTSVLKHLQAEQGKQASESPAKPALAVLTAQGTTTNKLVSVVEIVRRQLVTDGGAKLYQYNRLESVEVPEKHASAAAAKANHAGGEGEDDEAAFETLVLPSERQRVVPVLTVYLCCDPVAALRKLYGYVDVAFIDPKS